jgi:hypothetical protein
VPPRLLSAVGNRAVEKHCGRPARPSYGSPVSDEPTSDQLARHFHLDDADRAFVAEHRGDHNRLGVAVQLGSVRLLGTFLDDPMQAPPAAGQAEGWTRRNRRVADDVLSSENV